MKRLSTFNFQLSTLRGFTLIELLVAISIIAVLSAFLMANFVGARQRARDGVRKSDLRQIQSSLELYRSDKGSYPGSIPNSTNASCPNSLLSDVTNCSSTVYMKKVPGDPSSGAVYTYSPIGADNAEYSITACLENSADQQRDKDAELPNPNPCDQLANFAYTLQNP